MKKALHPIELQYGRIKERGLVVIKDVTALPTDGEPYVSPHLVIVIAKRGWLTAEYDMQPVEFHAYEVAVLYPNHILMAKESSEDYLATLLVVSSEFFERQRYRSSYRNYLEYMKEPSFRLDEAQYESVVELLDVVYKVSLLDVPARTDMLDKLMEVLSQLLDAFRFANDERSEGTEGDLLFTRFYDAVVAHYRESREVRFYADLLHLSPKYFATLIKQSTGVSASDWIGNYVIIQAKSMLNSRKELNILQVGSMLGFSDQAAFGRFFKQHTGMTPLEYRKKT